MEDGRLSKALERAELALSRIERSLASKDQSTGHDEQLRAKVREAVAELDQIIRAAGA